MADTQYYVIKSDGTVEVLTLPPDPEKKSSIWEKIGASVLAAGAVIAGVVVTGLTAGIGSVACGAIMGGALDIFMQVVISGTPFDDVDWKSVGVSMVVGGITAGLCSGASAGTTVGKEIAKTATQGLLRTITKQAAIGMLTGTITYLGNIVAHNMEFNLSDCLKAMTIGGATGAVAGLGGKLFSNVAAKSGMQVAVQILSGAGVSAIAYLMSIAITGKEFDLGDFALAAAVGAATTTLMLVGKKIVNVAKTRYTIRQKQQREYFLEKTQNGKVFPKDDKKVQEYLNKNLPSDKNAVYFDANGKQYKKIDFIKNGATGTIEWKTPIEDVYGNKIKEFKMVNGVIDLNDLDIAKSNPIYIGMQNGATKEEVRKYNFDKTYEKLSKLWESPKNRPTIVYDYMKSHNINKLNDTVIKTMFDKDHLNITIHECMDGRIMLIDKTIHSKISHIGAVSYYNQSSAMPEILKDYYGSKYTKTLSVTAQKANYYGGRTNIKGK